MKSKTIIFIVTSIILISSCTLPTPEPTPISTQIPTSLPTITPIPSTTPTPSPILLTIGSPFPPEWGTPRIWANDAYNAQWFPGRSDPWHGHVDISVPVGYSVYEWFDIESHNGDILAPVSGFLEIYPHDPQSFDITPEENTFPAGILDALSFAGIENPSLDKVTGIRYQFGHVKNIKTGWVEKGDVIADIEPHSSGPGHTMIAFKVGVYYEGVEYAFTPTLFSLDIPWVCHPKAEHDCEPESHDYAP